MGLTEYKLGSLIEQSFDSNSKLEFGEDDVKGMTITKEIIPTKANTEGAYLFKYLIVKPKGFIYNPRTHGKKIGLGFNNTEKTFIISWNNIAFRIAEKAKNILLSEYLYIYFKRDEWDRLACFSSWGSSTEVFSWKTLSDMDIILPSIEIQQKIVDAYNAISDNLVSYTDGLEDLKMTCDIYMDNIKKEYPRDQIGNLLKEIDVRNRDSKITNVLGINIEKSFMPSVANLAETDTTKYKVIGKGQFAYSPMQTGRDETIRVALFDQDEKVVISPAYSVLEVKNEKVLPEYLMVWFKRKESDRLGWFLSDGSVRASLEVNRFFEIEIPIPPKPIQQSIVDIYHAQYERQEIANKLNNTLREICPLLIKQSLS